MSDQIVFVVREKESVTTKLYKKVLLANAIMVGIALGIKLHDTLKGIKLKNQKGE